MLSVKERAIVLWTDVYVAAIRAGDNSYSAKSKADDAFRSFNALFL